MLRLTLLTVVFVSACCLAGAQPAPGDGSDAAALAASGGDDSTAPGDEILWPPGERNIRTFNPASDERENLGVRIARVVRRDELPGGPWAAGEIGDYLLENGDLRVIVRGEGRPPASDTPGTGNIVDVVLRDQMWDLIGGCAPMAAVDGVHYPIEYDTLAISPPLNAKSPPLLKISGHLKDRKDFPVVTAVSLDPKKPHVVMSTRCSNESGSKANVKILERVSFGSLPIFIEGYGIPAYTNNISVASQWISGILDDFCISVVGFSNNPTDAVSVFGNEATLLYDQPHDVAPGGGALAVRTFIVSRGDMAPVSAHVLASKGFDHGYLRGIVQQLSDGKPVEGAEVVIGMWHREKEEGEKHSQLQPFALTRTDGRGRYQIPLPVGDFDVRARAPGRRLMPTVRVSVRVEKNQNPPATRNIDLDDASQYTFEAVDAETGEPLPAKVRIDPGAKTAPADLGPAWKANGARSVQYLRPGPNSVTMLGGQYRCTFSRGPEYDTVTKEVSLDSGKPQTVRAELKRVVPTDGMVSVDLNLATEVSPSSRVSAEDLILGAAGEGVEWVVSGDLGQVTDLNRAVRALGLEKWIRASAGVQLSYQHPRLFGEFHVFPVPPETSPEDLAKLASPTTEPADFFKAVRNAFPGALISVVHPSYASASYLQYYGLDLATARSSFGEGLSMDFDAIEVFDGKSPRVRDEGWKILERLLANGHFKIPLASSKPTALYYDEPGYPRTYLVTGEDDVHKLSEADLVKALREGRFFVTNGPIIRHKIDGSWVASPYSPAGGEFVEELEVLGAPWIRVSNVLVKKEGRNYRIFRQTPTEELVKFPRSEESGEPYKWSLHYTDPQTKEERYPDACVHVEVQGPVIEAALTGQRRLKHPAFAVTAPLLLDINGDGEVRFERRDGAGSGSPTPSASPTLSASPTPSAAPTSSAAPTPSARSEVETTPESVENADGE